MQSNQINHDTTEPNNSIGIITIFVTFILLAISLLFCYFFFIDLLNKEQINVQNSIEHSEIRAMKISEDELLNRFEWKDKSTRTLFIPIDMAMDSVLRDY